MYQYFGRNYCESIGRGFDGRFLSLQVTLEKEDLAAAGATVTAAGSILAVTAAAVATVGAAAAVIAVDCPGEEPCTIWL